MFRKSLPRARENHAGWHNSAQHGGLYRDFPAILGERRPKFHMKGFRLHGAGSRSGNRFHGLPRGNGSLHAPACGAVASPQKYPPAALLPSAAGAVGGSGAFRPAQGPSRGLHREQARKSAFCVAASGRGDAVSGGTGGRFAEVRPCRASARKTGAVPVPEGGCDRRTQKREPGVNRAPVGERATSLGVFSAPVVERRDSDMGAGGGPPLPLQKARREIPGA